MAFHNAGSVVLVDLQMVDTLRTLAIPPLMENSGRQSITYHRLHV
jgi:hypothetical protein